MPNYIKLYESGRLERLKDLLIERLEKCDICSRSCSINRLNNEVGFCKTGRNAVVSSYHLHFGEEEPLVGKGGSGTIFFSWCNLGCLYCQNYSISHFGEGTEASPQKLSDMMLSLQRQGAHNINFVTPTHVIPQIIESLVIAVKKGLSLPLVYNSGGYDKDSILRKLDGVFDIYMPDTKYSNDNYSLKYSSASNYWEICQKALLEMYRQVGNLKINTSGIAEKGLLIRHLVLPNNIAGSFKVLDFIAKNISRDSYVNIMQQYHPCYKAFDYKELSRNIYVNEYKEVLNYAKKSGLYRVYN